MVTSGDQADAILLLSSIKAEDWPFAPLPPPCQCLPLHQVARAHALIEESHCAFVLVDGRADGPAALAALAGLADAAATARAGLYILADSHQHRLLDEAYESGADGFLLADQPQVVRQQALRFALRRVRRSRQAALGMAVMQAPRLRSDVPSWSWRFDDDRIEVSPALADMLGGVPASGSWRSGALMSLVHEADRAAVQAAIARGRRLGRDFEIRHRARSELGQRRNIRQMVHVQRDLGGRVTGFSATVEDTAHAAERDRFLSHYDGLTGLANIGRFRHLMRQAMIRARDVGAPGPALLIVGLSRFARLNSLRGRATADRFLQAVAARLQKAAQAAPQETSLARLGGAEFGILIEPPVRIRDAALLARAILDAIGVPMALQDGEVVLTARVGVAMSDPAAGPVDEEALLTHANTALAEAKEGEANSIRFYSDSFAASALRAEAMGVALRKAFDDGGLTLLFQPIVNIASGQMAGAEALLRWRHPELGLLTPDNFFAPAARAGLTQKLGDWVINEALRIVAGWQTGPLAAMRLSINLGAEQFRDRALAERLAVALARSGCDPERIILELTETVVNDNLEQVAALMGKLKALGVKLAIDDFGTGYSSLGYLKALPFDALKIDRVFIEDLPGERRDRAMLDAIVAMAKTLNMVVIAEGVEAREQLDILANCGCDLYQGYLFAPPLDADALAALGSRL